MTDGSDAGICRRAVARSLAAALALGLAACATGDGASRGERDVLEAVSNTLQVRDGDELSQWTLAREQNPDILRASVSRGEQREICFISADRSLCRNVQRGGQYDFLIRFQGVDYPTRIIGVPPPAEFDAAYQTAHRGRIEIEVPEVYELVAIAIAMTPTARAPNQLYVARSTEYYRQTEAHFAAFADHPFIQVVDAELRRGRYYNIKTNAYAFEYRDGQIVRSSVYDRIEPAGNALAPHLDLMRDFAAAAGFREFYRSHQALYREQEAFYRDQIGLEAMLRWLQAEFPSAPSYDGHKIIFSPLFAGNQGMRSFQSNGYRELQAHVDFPYPRRSDAQLPEEVRAFRRGEIVFTELNHGFVNPTADRHAEQISTCIGERGFWTVPGTQSDHYPSAQSVFVEMMSWALVALYADVAAPESGREAISRRLDAYMGAEGRGFSQFPAFRQHLLALRRSRPSGATTEALFPDMIRWCGEHGGAALGEPAGPG